MEIKIITVVSGLQRSGTSMLMQMLEKGGLSILTDNKRKADTNNPNGYYNHSVARNLPQNKMFLNEAIDKAVKIFAAFLPNLPSNYQYKVIFIERNLNEVWASFQKVSESLGSARMKKDFFTIRRREKFKKIIENAKEWAANQANVEILSLNYQAIIENPLKQAETINFFLGGKLEEQQMAKAVAPELHIERGKRKFLISDRAPTNIAPFIEKYTEGKVYCEIGIGEGHILNLVKNTKRLFGIEQTSYGVNRCKELYPSLEIIEGDALDVLPEVNFEVCYLWLTYPINKTIVNAILEKSGKTIVIMGLNYFYHLKKGDTKRTKYEEVYALGSNSVDWNEEIQLHLKELKLKYYKTTVYEIVNEENEEVFSVAVIQSNS